MMMSVTYPNHSNFIPAKNQNVSINFYRYEFGHWDLWIGRHPIPRLVLHHHREGGEAGAAQVAALGYDVGARALEVEGGVVKCVVMWISRDGADAFSQRLTWSHVVLHRTRLIRTTRGLLTLHLIWKTHLIAHHFQGVIHSSLSFFLMNCTYRRTDCSNQNILQCSCGHQILMSSSQSGRFCVCAGGFALITF